MWEPGTVALVVGAFLLAGSVKGLLGMGLPLVTLAVLASTLGVRETISVVLIPASPATPGRRWRGPPSARSSASGLSRRRLPRPAR